MSKGRDTSSRVRDFYRNAREALELRPIFQRTGFAKKLQPDSSSKSLSRIQIWEQSVHLDEKRTACLIIAEGEPASAELRFWGQKHKIALFLSPCSKNRCRTVLRRVLSDLFPKQVVVSGGLLQIFGLGVLIIGDSGVGKSESALELISRGYRFVSDDVTQIEKITESQLQGTAPALSRNFMEIRGLSIINIQQIFGEQAICKKSAVDLVINLENWDDNKKYDRLGLDASEEYEILGVKIPQTTIPVAPGRNISTLIEVACKVHILRRKGYHAPKEIIKRLDRALLVR
ncbi:MAG: HPr(Ser) kinase/phosphatase [Candidatus Aminicenantes bacterium]|nr:HPr(Ser) kinase/phosphatase [Candidatus Aminicenantes bacterium]